ncbi:MAG: hypothetical protein ACFFDN_01485 [Candidatus Hodarchaeota archaeon]
MTKEEFIVKIKKLYEKFLLFLYRIIKNRFFQKIFLIFTLISSIILSIALLILGIRIYPHTWFFLSPFVGVFTIPCFIISISIYFLMNSELFDMFCERFYKLFIKPWFLVFIFFFIIIGFTLIYLFLTLPNFTYYIIILPAFPFHILEIMLESYEFPYESEYEPIAWAGLISFILILPLFIYVLHYVGSKILSNIKLKNKSNNIITSVPRKYDLIKDNRNIFNLKKEIIIIWLVSLISYFLILYNTSMAFDTPFYYIFVKDYFKTGNLNLLFNPKSRSKPYTDLDGNYDSFPVILLLIFFTYICGGNIELGGVIMVSILFSITPPLIIQITKNITYNPQIARWAGLLFFLSIPTQLMLTGTLKQLLTSTLIIITLYLLSNDYKHKITSIISKIIVFLMIIIQTILYSFMAGLIYLILMQYLLRKKKFNFILLKNPIIYKYLKIIVIFVSFNIIIFFFLFGFNFEIFSNLFNYPLLYFKFFNFYKTITISEFFTSYLWLGFLGISFLFMIIGIFIDNKEKVIKKPNLRFLLIILSECILIFIFLNLFGYNFNTSRFIRFIPVVRSIFAAIGVNKLRTLFPKIIKKKPKFEKIVKISLLFTLVIVNILGTTYVRNGYALKEELDAIEWFKTRPDYEKLLNEETEDVQIICNTHLNYWVRYIIHYNAQVPRRAFRCLSSLTLDKSFRLLRAKAQDKLYILISENKEQFGENFTIGGLKEFFNEYRKVYPFTWTNYTINSFVVVWEIDYVDKI